MGRVAYVNGRYVLDRDAMVHIDDRGMHKRGRLSSRQHTQKNARGEPLKFENCRSPRAPREGGRIRLDARARNRHDATA